MEFDEDFQEEFSNIVSNDDIKEADKEFTPEVFNDTYLNMELALQVGTVQSRLLRVLPSNSEMRMDYQLGPRMTTPFSTLGCMRSSTKIVTSRQWRQM